MLRSLIDEIPSEVGKTDKLRPTSGPVHELILLEIMEEGRLTQPAVRPPESTTTKSEADTNCSY